MIPESRHLTGTVRLRYVLSTDWNDLSEEAELVLVVR